MIPLADDNHIFVNIFSYQTIKNDDEKSNTNKKILKYRNFINVPKRFRTENNKNNQETNIKDIKKKKENKSMMTKETFKVNI